MDELPRDVLLDLLHEYDIYIQDANDNERYRDGWYPVCISEFYQNEYQYLLEERAEVQAAKEVIVIPDNAFIYGGYHFIPYRAFRKGEIDRRLENDSRPWKKDACYAMRNMHSDFSIKLLAYSHKGFYSASNESECDIFRCVENDRLYVPAENELFWYRAGIQADKNESL